jgi:hypothetical protein
LSTKRCRRSERNAAPTGSLPWFTPKSSELASLKTSPIRAIEPSDQGSLIRHGLDGSGRFETFEDFETVAQMIDAADA